MSYLDNLTPKEKSVLKTFPSFQQYYELEKEEFENQTSSDFSTYTLKAENIIFEHDYGFTGELDCLLAFKNCYFKTDVTFHNVTIKKEINFTRCYFDNELYIDETSKFEGDFHLIEVSVKRQMYVKGGDFGICKWTLKDNGILKINGGKFIDLNIGYWGAKSILKQLSFHLPKVHGVITVSGNKSKIERLDFFQYSASVSLSVEDVSVNSISFYRYRNEKSLRLSNLKSFETDHPSQFSVVESYLGKAEFYSINFEEFRSINFLDAHFVDTIFVNARFSNSINAYKGRLVGKSEEERALIKKIKLLEQKRSVFRKWFKRPSYDPSIIAYYEKKREILRQLKYALSKQGDTINEQRFHSLEMKAHDRSLTWRKNFWTKLIIKASSWTGDFGQSIWRPFLFLLAGHLLLFYLLLLCGMFSHFYFSWAQRTMDGFWLGFHEYFKLINPLRKTDETFAGGFILVDILMRVWASYMIYNIIRASRRFIK
ncbi:hypothetical protein [Aridibaculum aurantiacum]|uniref:hypothetical protein n=1 Tax=Aridibaculum aurantiacum TaxID=2810307 RepID=UPI001A966B50|nr:hypothetical protein [Aridibaculum aurantiacum]